MRRGWIALGLFLGVPLSVLACIWDRDTPSREALGLREVVAALTGRFERNPALYHEMRLSRVAAHLTAHPDDLAAHDDAGAACDRLGRGDEAIAWMEKKRAALEAVDADRPEVKEHWYRYHANLGTFLVHRWARRGADRSKLDEVKAARDEIAAALAINPNAHFGREQYQLSALEWIIDPPRWEGQGALPDLLGWGGPSSGPISATAAHEAVRGLAGLVVLGNAWESVDIFHALNLALQHDTIGPRPDGRSALAYLAWLRCQELIDAGKGSLLPGAPTGEALKATLPAPGLPAREQERLVSAYRELRAEAESWQSARTAFLLARLRDGRHPDTDPRFWDGYAERPAPRLPWLAEATAGRRLVATGARIRLLVVVVGLSLVLVGLRAGAAALRRAKARRKPSASADEMAWTPPSFT